MCEAKRRAEPGEIEYKSRKNEGKTALKKIFKNNKKSIDFPAGKSILS
jgi:hypothetical protein